VAVTVTACPSVAGFGETVTEVVVLETINVVSLAVFVTLLYVTEAPGTTVEGTRLVAAATVTRMSG
jgi:PDZ domain-containing secreted protein